MSRLTKLVRWLLFIVVVVIILGATHWTCLRMNWTC
jgi:hypothetical protein